MFSLGNGFLRLGILYIIFHCGIWRTLCDRDDGGCLPMALFRARLCTRFAFGQYNSVYVTIETLTIPYCCRFALAWSCSRDSAVPLVPVCPRWHRVLAGLRRQRQIIGHSILDFTIWQIRVGRSCRIGSGTRRLMSPRDRKGRHCALKSTVHINGALPNFAFSFRTI